MFASLKKPTKQKVKQYESNIRRNTLSNNLPERKPANCFIQLRAAGANRQVVPPIVNVDITAPDLHGKHPDTVDTQIRAAAGQNLVHLFERYQIDTGNAFGNLNKGFFISFSVAGGTANVTHCGPSGVGRTAQL